MQIVTLSVYVTYCNLAYKIVENIKYVKIYAQ